MPIFRGSKDATVASGDVVASTQEIIALIEEAKGTFTFNGLATELVNNFKETVFTTDQTVDRSDGGIQVLDLDSNVTVTIDMDEGQSLTLHVKSLDTYTVSWPASAIFVGGLPATFNTEDIFEFWVVQSNLYGAWVGGV